MQAITGDAQAVSNTLAPFMALANTTSAPRYDSAFLAGSYFSVA